MRVQLQGDKITGKAKETLGGLTGNDQQKAEGQAQNLGGKVRTTVAARVSRHLANVGDILMVEDCS